MHLNSAAALSRAATALASVLALSLLLGGCEPGESAPEVVSPVAFHADDECHVCGMAITEFPGPKGQAIEPGAVRKFCSVAEMLGWWLQPENQAQNARLFVHDMTQSEWAAPDDARLIDAREAYFVPVADLPGAMGRTLATFASAEAAQAMASRHGSQVLRLEQLDLGLLQQPAGGAHHHH